MIAMPVYLFAILLQATTPNSNDTAEPIAADPAASSLSSRDDDEWRSRRDARRRRAAVEACRDVAAEEVEDAGLLGRVSSIEQVRQTGKNFAIKGVFTLEGQPRRSRNVRFRCVARGARVHDFEFRDPLPL